MLVLSFSLLLPPTIFLQDFGAVDATAKGFGYALTLAVNEITKVEVDGISLPTIVGGQVMGSGEVEGSRRLQYTTTRVRYSITVKPVDIGATSAFAAYKQLTTALLNSVSTDTPNTFTADLVQISRGISSSGITINSIAIPNGIAFSNYGPVTPSAAPTPSSSGSKTNANAATVATNVAGKTAGIVIGVILSLLVLGAVLLWYCKRMVPKQQDVETRDFSLARMGPYRPNAEHQSHDFDSETTLSPITFQPSNIIDIIPQKNPLADGGTSSRGNSEAPGTSERRL